MKDSIIKKLKVIQEQYHSIGNQLSDEVIQKNNQLMIQLSKEFSKIEPVVKLFEQYQNLVEEKNNAISLIDEQDDGLQELAKEEIQIIENQLIGIEAQITPLLLSSDPRDQSNIFLEKIELFHPHPNEIKHILSSLNINGPIGVNLGKPGLQFSLKTPDNISVVFGENCLVKS